MNRFFIDVDAWVVSLALGVVMMAAWAASAWRGRSTNPEKSDEPGNKFNDAILALLGLLLAFTFSMSLSRHEQRRQMMVTDSNAIGDFATSVNILDEPVRGKLRGVLRRYVEHRLTEVAAIKDETDLQRKLDEIREMHQQMEVLVKEAVDGGTPAVVPLVNTLNELTSAHAARLNAGRDRLPPSIILLLILSAVICMMLMGWQQGVSHEHHLGAALGFSVLVCMVLCVTLDLNQPQRGWITISQEPLEQLLKGMKE
ncbi:MAG: DUF4239 domain-containing protein [Planctomycetia bacterium]|nr:DUF4239 domain-containing protein [Planctomycetia bacterium]